MRSVMSCKNNYTGQKLNTNCFSLTFRAPPRIPARIPGYPAKKFGFPGLRGTYQTFWPPPLHVEDPSTLPEDIQAQKFGLVLLSLAFGHRWPSTGVKRPLPRKLEKMSEKGFLGASRPWGRKRHEKEPKIIIFQLFFSVFGAFSTLVRLFFEPFRHWAESSFCRVS